MHRSWIVCFCLIHGIFAIDILSDRVNEVVIIGKDGKSRTKLQHTVAIKCDQDDMGNSHEFRVLETVAGRSQPIVHLVKVTCWQPVFQYTHTFLGYGPVYTIDSAYDVCLTPFPQGNRSADATPLYEGVAPKSGLMGPGPLVTGMPQGSGFSEGSGFVPVESDGASRNPLLQGPNESPVLAAPKLKVSAILGAGLGIGVDLGCLTGLSFLGGCGGDGVDEALTAIRDQLQTLTDFAESTTEWMHIADKQFTAINEFQKVAALELERQSSSIEALNREIPVLWQFQKEVAISMTEGFTKTKEQIAGLAGDIEKVYKMVYRMFDNVDLQFVELTRAQQGLGQNLQDTVTSIWQIYQDLGMKRAVTKMFFDNLNLPFIPKLPSGAIMGPSHKFLGPARVLAREADKPVAWDYGETCKPPAANGFKGARTLSNSKKGGRVAYTNVLYTVKVGVRNIPVADEIRYICDPQFLVNHNVPGMTVKAMFSRLGPDTCLKSINNDPWQCNCVVEWTETTCEKYYQQYPTALFPWDQPNALNLEFAKNSAGQKLCEVGGTPKVTYLTSREAFSAKMTATYCTRAADRPVQVRVANGQTYAYRVTSNEMPAFWNLTLPTDVASCSANFTGAAMGSGSIAQTIFRAWQTTYNVISRTLIPHLETKYYGQLCDNVQTTNQPWAADQSTGGTYRCTKARFTSISNDKEPLHEMVMRAQGAGIQVKVTTLDDQGNPISSKDEPEIPLGIGEVSWLDLPDQNMSTNVVATIPRMNFLPPYMQRFGPSGKEGTSNYVYDTPADLISVAQTASARKGKLNYIFEPTTKPSPDTIINMDAWQKSYNKAVYDPDGATESLIWYRRELTPASDIAKGDPLECRKSFPTGAAYFSEYNWCLIMKHFDIDFMTVGDMTYIIFKPKQFSYIANLIFPAGTIQTVVSSLCPGVNIRQASGRAIATFTNPSTQNNRITVVVKTRNCGGKDQPCSICDGSKTIDMPPFVPTTYPIGECPGYPLELNVYTLERPKDPCFTPPLDVSATANRSGDAAIIDGFVDQRIRITVDNVADALSRQFEAYTDYQLEIAHIVDISKNRADLDRRNPFSIQFYVMYCVGIREMLRNRTIEINKQMGIKNFTDRIIIIDKLVDEQTKKVLDNLEKSKNATIEMNKKIKELDELNKQSKEKLVEIDKIIVKLKEDMERTRQAIDKFLESQKGKCNLSAIPILGDIACFVADIFGGVFRGIGGIFSGGMEIFKWIIFVLVIIGIVFCCVCCICECVKCARDPMRMQRMFNDASGSQTYPVPAFSQRDLEQIRCYVIQNMNVPCPQSTVQIVQKALPTPTAPEAEPLVNTATGELGARAGTQFLTSILARSYDRRRYDSDEES